MTNRDKLIAQAHERLEQDWRIINKYELYAEEMADFAIEQMQPLQSENKALKREVTAINKGAKTNALVNESLVKQVVDLTSQVRELREALESIHQDLVSDHIWANKFRLGAIGAGDIERAVSLAQAVLDKHKKEVK